MFAFPIGSFLRKDGVSRDAYNSEMDEWLVRHITFLSIPLQNWMVVTLVLILIASLINLGEKR
jgi:hypothetical protein